jgi:hypothetical protein
VVEGFALLAGYGAMGAYFLIQSTDHLTNLPITIGRNCSNIGDCLLAFDLCRSFLQVSDNVLNSFVNTLFKLSWADPRFNLLQALFVDGSGEDGSCRCTISSFIVSLIGYALHQTGPDIGGFISELNGLSDSDTVFGDFGLAIGLVNEYIAPTLISE